MIIAKRAIHSNPGPKPGKGGPGARRPGPQFTTVSINKTIVTYFKVRLICIPRGFLLTGTQFVTDYFLQDPAVEVAQLRSPRLEEAAEALRVHPAAEVEAQVCPQG
jgi:hypothetical protein